MAGSLLGPLIGAAGSIFGASKAASSAKKAAAQQAAGIEKGIGESEGLYTESQNFLRPYVESGGEYAGLMRDITGLGGQEGSDRALGMYRGSPSAALLDDVKGEVFRRGMNTFAASPQGANSGRTIEDLSRRLSDVTLNDYYKWQDLGKDMYGTGANAANAAANVAANRGQQILGARTGQGTALASGTAAGGLYDAAGTAGAANYLANALGRTDFSKYFGGTQPSNVYPGSNPYSSSMMNAPGFYGNY